MRSLQVAGMVALRHQHQRAVDRHDLVEEDRDVHRARLGHAVVALPGAVILVPLPNIAGERRLCVDLELMHVDFFTEELLDRLDHAWMRAEQAERLVVEMGGKGGARRTALLAPDLGPVGVIDRNRLAREKIHFFLAEQFRQEQPALAIEELDLLRRQFHDVAPVVSLVAAALTPPVRSPLSLSSVLQPAVSACACAAFSAAPALPAKISAAIASCSLQALCR